VNNEVGRHGFGEDDEETVLYSDYKALELKLEEIQKELEWFRTLKLIRDDGVTKIDGGETATKLHELWERAESARDVIGFYGDVDHYVKFISERTTPIRSDKGKRARKWLKGNK